MNYLVGNWFVIVALIACVSVAGYAVYTFANRPSAEQIKKAKEWLLYAVIKAEQELGSGTGKVKLRYVYDMFVARFVWLAKVIPFETFNLLVDEALEEMKKIIESNKAVQTLVNGEVSK